METCVLDRYLTFQVPISSSDLFLQSLVSLLSGPSTNYTPLSPARLNLHVDQEKVATGISTKIV